MSTPASPNDTVFVTDGATITDYSGNGWFIDNGQVAETVTDSSGTQTTVVDTDTANVVAIAYFDGYVWQLNAQGLWWAKTGGPGSYDGWTSGPGTDNSDGTRVSPLYPSPSGTVLSANASISPAPLVDASGNLWWISGSGQVIENGMVDTKTANVIEMAYAGGVIWQENASNLWWAKTGGPGSYDGWSSGPWTYNSNGTYIAPVPITLTWIGGGNNEAGNPADWNIPVTPAPGDELLFPGNGGTMNVAGNVLAGDSVLLDNNPGISPPAPYTFNLSGHVAMSIGSYSPGAGLAIVNLAAHSQWIGGYNGTVYAAGAVIQATGDGSGTFANTETDVGGSVVVVNAEVVGTGTFNVGAGHGGGKLEFMHAVGAGQSVNVSGGEYGGYGLLQVDDPGAFNAAATLGFGDVILEGLKATSYAFTDNGLGRLTLYNGDSVVDTIRLSVPATVPTEYGATDFGVSQIASGISIHGNGLYYQDGGTLLPLHG